MPFGKSFPHTYWNKEAIFRPSCENETIITGENLKPQNTHYNQMIINDY
jgi:hypothetical protein